MGTPHDCLRRDKWRPGRGRFGFTSQPLCQACPATAANPSGFGAGDVDLVTGTESPPHIIQSETFTAANPDNPNVVLSPTTTPDARPAITSPPRQFPPTAARPSIA